jgi:hypothetical protein
MFALVCCVFGRRSRRVIWQLFLLTLPLFFKSVEFLVDVPVANYGNSFRELCLNICFKCGNPHLCLSILRVVCIGFSSLLHVRSMFLSRIDCSCFRKLCILNFSAWPFQQFKSACFPNVFYCMNYGRQCGLLLIYTGALSPSRLRIVTSVFHAECDKKTNMKTVAVLAQG